MSDRPSSFEESIKIQRTKLSGLLGTKMYKLAQQCAFIMDDRAGLEKVISQAMAEMEYCKHLYVLNANGVQLTSNIKKNGVDESHFDRDRASRPYMQNIIGTTDFKLSKAYISKNNKRPSLTAVQVIRDKQGVHLGFLGADYDLRELPHTGANYKSTETWRQIKGDPAIRGGLFAQTRSESVMDGQIDEVLAIVEELIVERGIFHLKLHFSSSRGTMWHMDDPYSYRIHPVEELTDASICLAYPRQPYTERAIVPVDKIAPVFDMFKKLRFADDNIYLRAGSLNVINGMVGLNFSCDGSHYMPWDEFLDKNTGFWFGTIS